MCDHTLHCHGGVEKNYDKDWCKLCSYKARSLALRKSKYAIMTEVGFFYLKFVKQAHRNRK